MNRATFSFLGVMLIAALTSSCSLARTNAETSDQTVKISRTLNSPIESIEASTGIQIVYIQGEPQGMILEGRQKDIDRLDIFTDNGELKIERKSESLSKNILKVSSKGVKVAVTAPNVTDFDLSTGCELTISQLRSEQKVDVELGTGSTLSGGTIQAPMVSIEISTGGTGHVSNLLSDDVSIDVATGAGITVKGKGRKISIDASTGSSVDASGFKAERAEIDASTGSSVKYNSQSASVDSSTGSTVKNVAD